MNPDVRELECYIPNCAPAWQVVEYMARNYEKRIIKGTYDRALAVKGLAYAMEIAAKEYVREFCSRDSVWHKQFPLSVRKETAQAILNSLETEWQAGNHWGPFAVQFSKESN